MTNKRMLALGLALLMCLTILPASVLADDQEPAEEIVAEEIAVEEAPAEEIPAEEPAEEPAAEEPAEEPAAEEPAEEPAAEEPAAEEPAQEPEEEIFEIEGEAVENVVTFAKNGIDYEAVGGNATVVKYDDSNPVLVIPDTVTNGSTTYNVTEIASNALKGSTISSLTIGKKVKFIGGKAFAECTNLSEVIIKGNITTAGSESEPVFTGAGANMAVTFDNKVTKIPANLFGVRDGMDYASVGSISFGTGVTEIGAKAFYNCHDLTELTTGSALKKIGDQAFENCTGLTTLTLAKPVTTLGAQAFANCTSLETINFNATNLSDMSNGSMTFLKSGIDDGMTVYFGSNVKKVPAYLFCAAVLGGTPKISKMVFLGKFPSNGIGEFAFWDMTAEVYVVTGDTTWTDEIMVSTAYGAQFLDWHTATKPKFTTQPASLKVNEGKDAKFTVKVSGDPDLQWQISTDDGENWTDITGETNDTLELTAVTAAMDGYMYRCVATNGMGEVTSKEVKLTVLSAPSITTQPADTTVELGETATFEVEAKGGDLSYQWYWKEKGSIVPRKIKGATKAKYSFKTTKDMADATYYCYVKNSVGNVKSNDATLTLKMPPTILKNPTKLTVKNGNNATFTVVAAGSGTLQYQWYCKKSGDSKYYPISGANSDTYTFTVDKSYNKAKFKCIVFVDDGSGDIKEVTSKAATLTVKK